jgi:hypothetical protein
MDEKFIKKLLSNMKCGICGQPYEAVNINVMGHRDDLWFLSVHCLSCKSQGLVAAVVKEGESPEAVPEHTETNTEKSASSPPIDSDDVLNMYTFLEEFSGDFSSLFPKSKN